MAEPITIAQLPSAPAADRAHEFAVMIGGVTQRLSVGQVLSLIAAVAPELLDTIDELAAAINNNPNFGAAMVEGLAARLEKAQNLADLVDKAAARTNLGAVGYVVQALTAAQKTQARANIGAAETLPGHIWGLTLSNASVDVVNDITIAPGSCADSTGTARMVLASALTKRLDAPWAVASNAGGRDTGVIADQTYHVFLIGRSGTGAVDALFSLSATAPTMPSGYDQKRRIGSIIRSGGTILAFSQIDDTFHLVTAVADRSSSAATAVTVLTLTVPKGIVVWPILEIVMTTSDAGGKTTSVGSGTLPATPLLGAASVQPDNVRCDVVIPGVIATNTIGQIRIEVVISGGTLAANVLRTLGWIDTRGRLA